MRNAQSCCEPTDPSGDTETISLRQLHSSRNAGRVATPTIHLGILKHGLITELSDPNEFQTDDPSGDTETFGHHRHA